MWSRLRHAIRRHLTPTYMSKKADQIAIHATKEGKLYIKPSDLFAQPKVRSIIEKINNSPIIKHIQKGS